jgi:hypothetical protein
MASADIYCDCCGFTKEWDASRKDWDEFEEEYEIGHKETQSKTHSSPTSLTIADAYNKGIEEGIKIERQRLIRWVEKNRTSIKIDDEFTMHRDHFRSEDLITFINKETK